VFALQDAVVQRIVAALAVELTSVEEQRLSNSAQAHPEAYDMLLRGLERMRRFTRETNAEAREFFERAVALDPSFARAHADLAFTYGLEAMLGWADDPDASTRKSLRMALHALELDNSSREVYFVLSNIYRNLKRHEESIEAARRAIQIDPNYADAYAQLATALNYAGRAEEGLEQINRAMRLNPRHPFFYVWVLGQSYYLLDRLEEAAAQFEAVKRSNPHFTATHMMLAATYVELGRVDDAQWAASELETLRPNFSLAEERQRTPYKDEPIVRRYIDSLRRAGLPE
jgi:adenylate cyclase